MPARTPYATSRSARHGEADPNRMRESKPPQHTIAPRPPDNEVPVATAEGLSFGQPGSMILKTPNRVVGHMPFADLHRRPDRRAYFGTARNGVAYDTALRCWIVDDPDLVVEALRDPRVGSVDYVAGARQRGSLTGHPLDNQEFAFHHIPIGWEGPDHAEKRKTIARHMAARRDALEVGLPRLVEQHVDSLDRSGEIDLVPEFLVPLVNDLTGLLIGIDIGQDLASKVSPLFDRLLSLRRHTEIDQAIGEARDAIRLQAGDNRDIEGIGTALWILGYDAQLGTLGESLRLLFEKHSGSRIGAIPFPDSPPETGVPYAERDAIEDIELGGCAIRKGDRLRIMFQGFSYSERPDRSTRIFGVGAHACLGRPLSLDLWKLMVDRLARIDRTVTFVSAKTRVTDYVFVCPSSLKVRIDA